MIFFFAIIRVISTVIITLISRKISTYFLHTRMGAIRVLITLLITVLRYKVGYLRIDPC